MPGEGLKGTPDFTDTAQSIEPGTFVRTAQQDSRCLGQTGFPAHMENSRAYAKQVYSRTKVAVFRLVSGHGISRAAKG
jgi:hypothetical protein